VHPLPLLILSALPLMIAIDPWLTLWSLLSLPGITLLVLGFQSSSNLASAYGIAVAATMVIECVLAMVVARLIWKWSWASVVLAIGSMLLVDLVFLASNTAKFLEGGWFPLLIGCAMFTLMVTWKRGRLLLGERLRSEAIELDLFLESIFTSPPLRVPGTAVFLSAEQGSTPFALLHNLKHNKVLHEQNLFVTVLHHEQPWIRFDKRCEIEALGHDCWQVTLHFGFKNEPDVPEALKMLQGRGVQLNEMETSYFLSRDTVVPTFGGSMPLWREKLFASMHRNAAGAADFLHLPTNRIVELGSKIEI